MRSWVHGQPCTTETVAFELTHQTCCHKTRHSWGTLGCSSGVLSNAGRAFMYSPVEAQQKGDCAQLKVNWIRRCCSAWLSAW